MVERIEIRKAMLVDADGIAQVHFQSWRETYVDLMPEAILSKVTLSGRQKLWCQILTEDKNVVWVAHLSDQSVIGFLSVCRGRDERFKEFGEIPGLYILKKFQGQGVGTRLLHKGLALIREMGFSAAYLWVLKNNPAEHFYRRMGGVEDGEKTETMAGFELREVFYVWPDLNKILVEAPDTK